MSATNPQFHTGDCEGCDHGIATTCEDCADSEVAGKIADWIDKERCKPGGLTSVEIAVLERCAEDLR